jgi:hypothetical protein
MTAKPKVFLGKLADDYAGPVEAGLGGVGFFGAVPAGATVFLKPNFTFPSYRPGVMTSFACVKATTECLIGAVTGSSLAKPKAAATTLSRWMPFSSKWE